MFPEQNISEEEITEEESTEASEPETSSSESQVIELIPESPAPAPYTVKDFKAEAKSLISPGVNRDDSLAEAGRKILRYQFAQMLLNEDGTRLGEDIEALHDMRVATRECVQHWIFLPGIHSQNRQNFTQRFAATGRRLGRVRDQDVFIDNAHHYLLSLPEEHRADLNPLIASWEDARQKHRQDMLIHLDSKVYREFKEDLLAFVNTPGSGVRSQPEGLLTPNLVCEIAPKLIYACLGDVRAFEPLLDTATLEQFHALRIAFKKFRYAVEFFQEVLGAEVKLVITDLKKIQITWRA